MALTLFNTLTRQKVEFKPISSGNVGMYNCGPTVYDYAHIGNLRAYIFADILRRTLEYQGLNVKQVINITDIGHLTSDSDSGDDKMTKGLKREGLPLTFDGLKVLSQKYVQAFEEDLEALNIQKPSHVPMATEYVADDIEFIKILEEKGFAYKISDGMYFDTGKLPQYGKLGGLTPLSEAEERIEATEKKSPRDFAVWKFSKDELGFESPWGKGFPGWHIECSVMSEKLLGQPFDIHTGGTDHIPVHHNNEIAQSEAAYDKPLANVWMHGAFITLGGDKMAKSSGGFITLQTFKEKKIDPLAYRYFVLGAHYRSMLNFTWESVEGAATALGRLVNQFVSLGDTSGIVDEKYKQEFLNFINDDLDIPQAIALAWQLVKDDSVSSADKRATLLDFDKVLGFGLEALAEKLKNVEIPVPVKNLAMEREIARKAGNFARADELRNEIHELGFTVEDSAEGPKLLPR